jgi:soluble lytic murein transglycosylase
MAKKILLAAAIVIIIAGLAYRPILKRLYPVQNKKTVEYYSQEYGLDPMLVYSVIKVESRFNPYATSSKGAKGLMQITSSTGKYLSGILEDKDFSDSLLYEKETNIRYGCYYLSKLLNDFQGDLVLALAAYNGGEGNVRKWLKEHEGEEEFSVEDIPFTETRCYVKKVTKNYNMYRFLYGEG